MARREIDEWGIRFRVDTDAAGYEWQRIPDVNLHEDVLAPAGTVRAEGGTIVGPGETRIRNTRLGRGIARAAVVQFRELAEALTKAELVYEGVEQGEYGELRWEDERGRPVPTLPEAEVRAKVADFAGEFGLLWGDRDRRTLPTLGEWRREAATFLDIDDVARALRTAVFTEFERGVLPVNARMSPPELQWHGSRPYSQPMIIAREGEVTDMKAAVNALPRHVDYFEQALTGSPRTRALMLFSREINAKLAGGLSLSASLLTERKAAVTPRHLIHTIYAKLWLDTVRAEAIDREMRCLTCQREIEGTRRKKFCSDECRWKYNNRRRATG
jgi:hypothetical protein